MPDPREQEGPSPKANHDRDNTAGREANAARPLDKEQPTEATPERYPSVRQDDSVEARTFDPQAGAPTPRQGAGDGSVDRRMGPGGAPAEGKRD